MLLTTLYSLTVLRKSKKTRKNPFKKKSYLCKMKQSNIYKFEYEQRQLTNKDGSKSRFSIVYGEGGNIVHTKKDSYHIIPTADVSILASVLTERGYAVTPFVHRKGEVIGLNVAIGDAPSKVGDSSYRLYITIPNNGGGKGYLSIKQTRMICTNGAVSSKLIGDNNYIRIPHTIEYKDAMELMKEAITSFNNLFAQMSQMEKSLDADKLDNIEAMKLLNLWYYEYEMPTSHKKEMSLNAFRKALAVDPQEVQSIDRYNQLIVAFNRELEHNRTLNLKLSRYTVFASVTNYLSRRSEMSRTSAPVEIADIRSEDKLKMFQLS